jgi:hypothetical protein
VNTIKPRMIFTIPPIMSDEIKRGYVFIKITVARYLFFCGGFYVRKHIYS